MPRGETSATGTERTAVNGYTYVKTDDRGWVLKHWIVWEQANGRRVNPEKDMIRFANGDRTNFDPENIICIEKNHAQLRKKIARLYAAKDEVIAQIKYYEDLLARKIAENDERAEDLIDDIGKGTV